MSWWIPLALALLTMPLLVGLWRVNELFVLRVHQGKVRVVRGRIPGALLGDIADVVGMPEAEGARLKGVVRDGRAAIDVRGPDLSGPLRQRLRNVISLWPVAKIRNARRRR